MELLSACPLAPPATPPRRGISSVTVTDGKTRQQLVITGDEPFVVYQLDDPALWPKDARKPDAVLITRTWVCFLELKGSVRDGGADETRGEHAVSQLASGAVHFAPVGRCGAVPTHGDEHHDRWSFEQDLLAVMPTADHALSGVIITFAGQSRVPPVTEQLAGKTFTRMVVQLRGIRQQAHIDLAELRRKVFGP